MQKTEFSFFLDSTTKKLVKKLPKRSKIDQDDGSIKFRASLSSKSNSTMGAILKCDNCGFVTKQSGHFKVHKAEGCLSSNPRREKNCPICCQEYTYNQLRYHLRRYLIDSSKATNGHANFTPEEHRKMLNKLKEERKIEKKEEQKKFKPRS